MADDEDDGQSSYQVGYRRPPRAHQFKPGKSGNANGRPKASKNFDKLLAQELDQKVIVTDRGRKRSISKRQVMIKMAVSQAMKGDLKAFEMLLRSTRIAPQPEPVEFDIQSDTDLEEFLSRLSSARQEEINDAPAEVDPEQNLEGDDISE